MLAELRIRNFAIIESLELAFAPGLNILTGETGAGKSIIIDAVSLLLGGRADADMVRSGAERAEIEGTLLLNPGQYARLKPLLEAEGLEAEEEGVVILSREVREGRSIGRINGRVVALSLLKEVGQALVDIHTQGEHLSLLRVRQHLELLGRYAGLGALRKEFADEVHTLQQLRRELQSLQQDERERAQRVDMLRFQVDEIAAAHLSSGEEKVLTAERNRLANAEQLAQLTAESLQALEDETGDQSGALDRLGVVVDRLGRLVRVDGSLTEASETVETLFASLSDLMRTLRDYEETVEFNPARLVEVEDRLALLYNLRRKYGESVEEVIAYGERAAQELETITNAGERIATLEADEEKRLLRIGDLGMQLSQARREAGDRLSQAVEQELADLQMERTLFAVDIRQKEEPQGAIVNGRRLAFDVTGLDRVEFLVSTNPGEPLRPLVKVASGGETSRLMLALKTVLSGADDSPTLIFDEVDVGIGGRIGSVVGQKLWRLTRPSPHNGLQAGAGHQVLCVTHLAQLAAYGDRHLKVQKEIVGERAQTAVVALADRAQLEELASMLGTTTEAGHRSVAEILAEVDRVKVAANRQGNQPL